MGVLLGVVALVALLEVNVIMSTNQIITKLGNMNQIFVELIVDSDIVETTGCENFD